MRAAVIIAAVTLAAVSLGAARHGPSTKGVANALLAATARTTALKLIDYDEDLCRNDRTVQQWIRDLGPEVAAVTWTGGPCRLVGEGIDSGSEWCAQASISLKRPMNRRDRPMVEIFFEKPNHGAPGVAYAFRGDLLDSDGEGGVIRFRRDFEGLWEERFPASKAALECPEE